MSTTIKCEAGVLSSIRLYAAAAVDSKIMPIGVGAAVPTCFSTSATCATGTPVGANSASPRRTET